MLFLSAVDHGFEPRSGQTKDNEISICCFSTKHAAFRGERVRNQNNVSESSEMSTTKPICLVQSAHHYHLNKYKLFST